MDPVTGYVDVYRKHILGPMPVATFLEWFLPPSPNLAECPDSTEAFKYVPHDPAKEQDLYDPMAFNPVHIYAA